MLSSLRNKLIHWLSPKLSFLLCLQFLTFKHLDHHYVTSAYVSKPYFNFLFFKSSSPPQLSFHGTSLPICDHSKLVREDTLRANNWLAVTHCALWLRGLLNLGLPIASPAHWSLFSFFFSLVKSKGILRILNLESKV